MKTCKLLKKLDLFLFKYGATKFIAADEEKKTIEFLSAFAEFLSSRKYKRNPKKALERCILDVKKIGGVHFLDFYVSPAIFQEYLQISQTGYQYLLNYEEKVPQALLSILCVLIGSGITLLAGLI